LAKGLRFILAFCVVVCLLTGCGKTKTVASLEPLRPIGTPIPVASSAEPVKVEVKVAAEPIKIEVKMIPEGPGFLQEAFWFTGFIVFSGLICMTCMKH
jgi:predicted component of type VI protein secretion system